MKRNMDEDYSVSFLKVEAFIGYENIQQLEYNHASYLKGLRYVILTYKNKFSSPLQNIIE